MEKEEDIAFGLNKLLKSLSQKPEEIDEVTKLLIIKEIKNLATYIENDLYLKSYVTNMVINKLIRNVLYNEKDGDLLIQDMDEFFGIIRQ